MADFNVSVTMSSEPAPSDISAGASTTYIIDNPLTGSSYFTLETVPNNDGNYDSTTPKNCEGTYTLGSGLTTLIHDEYKAGVVVSSGGGSLVFVPDNNIVASTLRLRGVGAGYALSSSLPSFSGILDEFPNASAAFSIRRLSLEYTGSLIEIRREGDNTVQDIGFDSYGNLDTGSLLSFVNSVEVFTNPDITSPSSWTLGANTTYNAGTEAFDLLNENGLTIRQGVSVEGRVYNITLTISSTTSGGVKVYAGGNQSAVYSTVGVHELTITGGSTNNILGINPNGSATLSISAFSAIDTTNNGYVRTWYDQSGNNLDVIQTSTANQPQIVNEGSIILTNNTFSIQFNGSTTSLSADSNGNNFVNGPAFGATVSTSDNLSLTNDQPIFARTGDSSNVIVVGYDIGSVAKAAKYELGYQFNPTHSVVASTQYLHILDYDGSTNFDFYQNNAISTGNQNPSTDLTANRLTIGSGASAAGSAWKLSGSIQEVILYEADKGSDKDAIQTNINTYYNIYSLLEQYPGSVGGYSLRKISAQYTGNAIEVTRESDSTTQDIGFDSNGDLDTSALTTFCAGTNGFITTWYDQGTNVNNATTLTLGSSPKIYDSSTGLITVNGKPAMLFDEGDEFFRMPIPSSSRQDFFVVLKTNDPQWILMEGDDTSDYNFAINSASLSSTISNNYGTPSYYKNGVLQSPSTRTDMYNIFSTDTQLLLTNLAGDSSTWGNQFDFGFYSSQNSLQGYVQEAIYYNSDQSSNQSDIENNINSYYNIYS